jgi:hypothetical protein
MAKISTYPILSTPTLNDLLIGTDVENLNITKNFSIGDIASFIVGGSYVPYVGATGNVNLGAFNITSSSFIVGGGLATQFLKANGTLDSTVYQPAGNYITQLSGEATASGPGNASVTLSNSAVINKVLTGLTITGNAIVATDSILTAFGKVQNQINTLVGGVQYKGTWNAATNVPALVSSVGVAGNYYVVSVAGNTNLNGITDWNLGDWAIFNGSAWEKVDNTDAVISVNGQVGAVVLTTTNISEGTNLYFTNSRARTAINLTTTGNSGAATYNNTNGFFNIPEYTLSGLGGVPSTRELTINGTAFDLSANRSWSVGTVTSIATTGPLTGGTITGSGTIGITQSGVSSDGYLSSTDWNTFNNKQNALTNPVTGTGTIFTLPMWGGATSLIDSPLSYGSNNFNFQYNSAIGGTVTFTNSGLTAYAYTIQMNNFGSPRSTVHSYTDGVVIQSIASTQVSRLFANGNFILGAGTADNGHKLEITGSLYVNTIANATVDTDRFIVSDGGVIKYRTGTELRADIGAGIGTVTSVGLSMPSAFSVANSPITGAGTIAVTGAGVASQYVRGDGTLADFPTTTGGGSSVSYYLNGSVSQGTIVGVAYKELSKTPVFGAGTDISISVDGYIASFITDAGDPNSLEIPAGNWNFETYFSASSSGGTPNFYVELYRYDGTTFTLIASSVSVPEFIAFGTTLNPYFSTLAVPQTSLALTDRLAVRYYVNTSGRTITLHTENNHLCQIVTTFSRGLTALNGLTAQVQYFQVGSSGTDFNISSATATHTFNLPTASATNRGLLSAADWTTFNNKANAGNYVTLDTTQTITAQKSFTTSGSSDTMIISHSGSGFALDAIKAGNGDVIRVNKTSGSGNAMTVIGGNFEAPTIVKTGGTSTQYLMADGSTSTLTNPVTGTGASGQVPLWNGTSSQTNSIISQVDFNASPDVFINTSASRGVIIGNGISRITNMSLVVGGNMAIKENFGYYIERSGGVNSKVIDSTTGFLTNIYSPASTSGGINFLSANANPLFRIFANTGNVLIQNGGTFTDAGFRLDVNGSTRFNGLSTIQGTTASDSGQLGAELLTTGTGDASWTGTDFATGYTHVAGSTTTLTSTLAGVVNTFYQITYTVTGRTAGSFTIRFGGFISGNLAATGVVGPRATTTDSVVITPTSDFNGTIVLSIKTIGTSSASVTFNNSAGTVTNQIRVSNSGFNSFIGLAAGNRNTTGIFNTAFGSSALRDNTTGGNNTAVGFNASGENSTGGNNTAVGFAALSTNLANSNTAIGSVALRFTTTGGNNTAVGFNASAENSTGANNVAVGFAALLPNRTGGNNVAIGDSAGRRIFDSSANTTTNNSIFIGYNTRALGGNQTNQIVIGYDVVGLGSNTTVIGNSSTTHGRWYGSLLLGTTTNAASSILTMVSTTQGFLPPRMTSAERTAIASPATGLIVYQTDGVEGLYVRTSTAWRAITML